MRSSIVIEQPRSEPASWAPKKNVPFVYVTFGTLAGEDEKDQALYKATLAAIAPLPIQALLTTGPVMATAELGDIPQNVIVKQWVTQSEVLLLALAVVCHGGSGTLLGALAAGLPLVVAPMFADQPDNARQVERVGAGIAVLEPDVTLLRAAIQRVLEEKEFREKAAHISAEISALPDIRAAVDAMLEHIVV
jgi:MGT family glycosyltransferase